MSQSNRVQRIRTRSYWRAWLGVVVLLATAHTATGCSTLQQPSITDAVKVETVDSPNTHVSTVRTKLDDDGIAVTGYVEKRWYRGGLIPGHLLIEVIGREGKVLAQTEAGYRRHFARSNRAFFSESLSIDPDEESIVRVTHVGLGH